ncbi:ABC transporter substrate-binding protein [Trueperella sp. LYQ143]|uniref:ABC transporter substrate-binding protein n=1 Tax=Trueperella sp. LYQ143 TaxID=3391059 RepID=UPI003982F328
MRSSKRWATVSAVATAAMLALAACGGGGSEPNGSSGGSASGNGAPSGVLNLGVAYETTNYDPSTTSSALALGANWQVMEGLYEFDMSNYEVYPALAAGEPKKISDTEYEITLREGAKFSDGTPVTSADVAESYKRTTADTSIYKQFFTFVDSVAAKDDKTVTVKLKYPFANLSARLVDVKIIPAAKSQDEMKAKPIGTGPYKFDTITSTAIEASPNEFYNGSKPATVSKIHWDVLKDDSARLSAALGGTIDVMEAVPSATKKQLEAGGWKLDEVGGYNNAFLMFNTSKAPFNDPAVRQAFHHAIDRQKLVDQAMEGDAKVATSFLPESNPMYKKATTQFDFNTDLAKQAFSKAGLKEVTLITTDHPWIANLAPLIRQDLEAAGLKVNVQSMASGDLYSNFADIANPTYDVALAPGDPSVFGNDPGIIIDWWYGDNVWTKQRDSWQKSAPEAFAQLRELSTQASKAQGEEAKQLWGQAQDLIAQEAPIYPLFHRTIITGYNPNKVENVKGVGTTGLLVLGAKAKQ